jgi:molybdate transport system substrate-binding protein
VDTSDAVAVHELKTLEIPIALNVVAEYPIAPLAKSANSEVAARFIEYVLSDDGEAILQKWGFGPIP